MFSVAVSLCAPYVVFVLQASAMGINSSSPGAIFFLLVFAVNALLGLVGRCFSLGRGDLVLVYAMLMMAVTAPTYNFLNFLIVIITGPYYMATAENEFAEIYHPYIPDWMVPQDRYAIFHLYEGLPRGESIPWGAWIEPLGHWFPFYLALSFMISAWPRSCTGSGRGTSASAIRWCSCRRACSTGPTPPAAASCPSSGRGGCGWVSRSPSRFSASPG